MKGVLLLLGLAACGPPPVETCALACGAGELCPPGYGCDNGFCAPEPVLAGICAGAADATTRDGSVDGGVDGGADGGLDGTSDGAADGPGDALPGDAADAFSLPDANEDTCLVAGCQVADCVPCPEQCATTGACCGVTGCQPGDCLFCPAECGGACPPPADGGSLVDAPPPADGPETPDAPVIPQDGPPPGPDAPADGSSVRDARPGDAPPLCNGVCDSGCSDCTCPSLDFCSASFCAASCP